MSHTIIITRVFLILGLLLIAGCTSPHQASSAVPSNMDGVLLTGSWGELDTGGAFTFAADGSFRYDYTTDVPTTRTGSYTFVSPGVVEVTFTGSNPHPIKYCYVILKNGQRLISTECLAIDSMRKGQQ